MKTYKLNDLNNPLISVLMPAYNAGIYNRLLLNIL